MRVSKLAGFSLIEVIVSAVLLSLTLAGLVSIFVAAKRHLFSSQYRISGGELGRVFLAPLQNDVRQDQWGNNCLSSNPTAGCPGATPINDITYTPTYIITPVQGTALRRTQLTLSWQEPQP